MHTYDPQKAAQVWQRVQNQKNDDSRSAGTDSLTPLIMAERESAAACLQLARQLPSKHAAVLQKISQEEQAHATCLKGIHTITAGQPPAVRTPAIAKEVPQIGLRKCYGRHMRMLREYEKRCDDPEYGPVFRQLAEQEQEHCRKILELIGSLFQQPGR